MFNSSRSIGQSNLRNLWVVGWVIVLVGIALVVGYLVSPATGQGTVQFIASVIGGVSGVFATYFAGYSFYLNIIQNKRVESFKFLGTFNQPEFIQLPAILELKPKSPPEQAEPEFYKLVNGNKDYFNSVKTVLGSLEDLSIAIQMDYVDELVLYRSLSSIVISTWNALSGYIAIHRKKWDDNDLYIEFEALYKAWKDRNSLLDGKPFPKEAH